MRGGERLTDECSQMNGICSGLHHSTGIFRYPGGGRYIKVSQRAKPIFALWDACHATTMACILGDVPRLRSPSRGEAIYAVITAS